MPIGQGSSHLSVFGATNSSGSAVEIGVAAMTSKRQWSLTWRSEPIDTMLPSFLATGGLPVETLTSVMPKGSSVALVAFNINTGSPHTSNDVIVLRVASNGDCQVVNHASLQGPMTAETNGDAIVVEGQGAYGRRTYHLGIDGKVNETSTSRSAMGVPGAVSVHFTLEANGSISVSPGMMTMDQGSVISFIPADWKTKQAFDSGHIGLYTDAFNWALRTTDEASIRIGNSFTASRAGMFHFLIATSDEVYSMTPTPTFTLTVH